MTSFTMTTQPLEFFEFVVEVVVGLLLYLETIDLHLDGILFFLEFVRIGIVLQSLCILGHC